MIQVRTNEGHLLQGDLLGTGKATFSILLHDLSVPLVASDFIFA